MELATREEIELVLESLDRDDRWARRLNMPWLEGHLRMSQTWRKICRMALAELEGRDGEAPASIPELDTKTRPPDLMAITRAIAGR